MDVNKFMFVTVLSEASPQGDPLCLPLLTTQANKKQPQLRTRSKSPSTGYGGKALKHLANIRQVRQDATNHLAPFFKSDFNVLS